MPDYQAVFDRVGLLISVDLDALLARALGVNSVAVFDEYINRMNGALDWLQAAEEVERGHALALARLIEGLRRQTEQLDRDVDRLLERGERALAAARQAVLNGRVQLLEQLLQEQRGGQAEAARLVDWRARLVARIDLSAAKRQQLVALIAQNKAAAQCGTLEEGGGVDSPDHRRGVETLWGAGQMSVVAEGTNEASSAVIDAILGTDDIERQLREREEKMLAQAKTSPALPEHRDG